MYRLLYIHRIYIYEAIRKRGVLDWVQQSGEFKRLLNSRSSAHASVVAEKAKAPYLQARRAYK